MPAENENAGQPKQNMTDAELMERYGILRAPADYFLYRGYRYSNVKDAIAQVERDRVAGQGAPAR